MRLLLLSLLCVPLWAQQKVLVIQCASAITGDICDKVSRFLSRVDDKLDAAGITTDGGLQFGEPACEPVGTPGRRCAWSHDFSLAALDVEGRLSDETWFRNRLAAIKTNLGLTLAQLQKAIDFRKVSPAEVDASGVETKAEVTPLPADWVPSPRAQSVKKPDRQTAPK